VTVHFVRSERGRVTSALRGLDASDIAAPLLISPKVLSVQSELGHEPVATMTKERSGP